MTIDVPFFKGLSVKDVIDQFEEDHTCFEYLPEFADIFSLNRGYVFNVISLLLKGSQILYTNDGTKLRKYVDQVLEKRKKAIYESETNVIDICPELKKAIMSSNQVSCKCPYVDISAI